MTRYALEKMGKSRGIFFSLPVRLNWNRRGTECWRGLFLPWDNGCVFWVRCDWSAGIPLPPPALPETPRNPAGSRAGISRRTPRLFCRPRLALLSISPKNWTQETFGGNSNQSINQSVSQSGELLVLDQSINQSTGLSIVKVNQPIKHLVKLKR